MEPRINAQSLRFIEFARRLRKDATDAENLVWRLVRAREVGEAKFRRQHPVGLYVLDFYCHELRFAIEVDGSQHLLGEGPARDERRTRYLESCGIRLVRFTDHEVLAATDSVATRIWDEIAVSRAQVAPSP